ncbi:MAG: hypothetical protein GXY86_11200 [Firmicutes bacterium]|nr:hypothetical protein [Bacillota bacterium]
MGEIKIDLNRFDLMGFMGVIFNFLRLKEIWPEVVYFSEDGEPLKLEADAINRDSIQELLFQGKIIFLPFSDINVGEPIPCADGGQYLIIGSDEFDEEVGVSANEIELVGFLIRVSEAVLEICPAVFRGGEYETVNLMELEEDLKEFSEPMDRFVNKFVKN